MAAGSGDADGSLYRALIDSCGDVFAVLDTSGVFTYVTPSVEQVLGYSAEERIGRRGTELVHEEDRQRVGDAFARVLSSPLIPFKYGCRVRHRDGSWRHIESTAVFNPAVAGVVINYRDITREKQGEELLRQSEARYRSLIHGALYGIYRTSLDGRILDANPAFARMLGYATAAELDGLNMREVYANPDDRDAIVNDALASERGIVALTVNWKRRDGSPLTARVSARLVHDAVGSGVDCFEGIVEDVTERRAIDQRVRQSQKMEAVGRLARGIAHDFNNVLAAIVGNVDLLQLRLAAGDPMAADLDEITTAAERGASLTRQLLAFSRPSSGGEPRLLNVHEVVAGIDSMLRRLTGDVELQLCTRGASPTVRMPPGQIEQLVMNLVLNAREAIESNGVIEVHADALSVDAQNASHFEGVDPGRYARLLVRDNGRGIRLNDQAHVFDPFFSTKEPATGSGLGLAIVYGIAKDAGGAVRLTSAPGAGTTFEVLLPAVPDVDPARPKNASTI